MYFPKSKVQSNLYTNGDELKKVSTQEIYIGFYFKTSRGQYFTGKNPGDGLNEQLTKFNAIIESQLPPQVGLINTIPPSDFTSTFSSNFITPVFPTNDNSGVPIFPPDIDQTYGSSIDSGRSYSIPSLIRKIPNFIQPIIKESDRQLGIIQRYFCKKTNEAIYIEISLSDYSLLLNKSNIIAWDLYIPVSMLWYLKGDKETIFNTNKNLAALIERNNKWFGFVNYFKDNFTQFYLES